MGEDTNLDGLFERAVAAVDAGNVQALEALLAAHPKLACQRLDAPGGWLQATAGGALEGFFERPYLLWFVAEDPVRRGTLPPNIADVARVIVQAATRTCAETVQEQVDYGLQLVAWSWIARERGVQLALIDVLMDAGASGEGAPGNALVNGNNDAAVHLIERGAPVTLEVAACLRRWEDAERLVPSATPRSKQHALTLAALRGRADAAQWLLDHGADVNAVSADLYSHAMPLHHAVSSGSLDTVRTLVAAGARLDARDTAHDGTPLEWAEYSHGKPAYDAIADYLRALKYGRT